MRRPINPTFGYPPKVAIKTAFGDPGLREERRHVSAEILRSHSDDAKGMFLYHDLLAQNSRVGMKSRLPEPIADHNHRGAGGQVLIGREPASQGRAELQHLRIVRRHAFEAEEQVEAVDIGGTSETEDREGFHRTQAVAQFQIFLPGAGGAAFTNYSHHSSGIGHGQTPEVHAVEKAEERGIHAHRQTQAEHRGGGVSGIAAQVADRHAQVHAQIGNHSPVR